MGLIYRGLAVLFIRRGERCVWVSIVSDGKEID